MSDTLYVNDNGTPVPLNLGTGIEYVQRIETLEQNAATQAARDAEQDAAISAAQTAANNAQTAADTANEGLVGVVRSVNGVSADATGDVANVEIVDSKTFESNGYMRYASGLQICWGTVTTSNTSSGQEVTFLKPFASWPIVIPCINYSATGANLGGWTPWVGNTSATSFKIYSPTGQTTHTPKNWIAIGYWK